MSGRDNDCQACTVWMTGGSFGWKGDFHDLPSDEWFRAFLNRHNEISGRTPTMVTGARARLVQEGIARTYRDYEYVRSSLLLVLTLRILLSQLFIGAVLNYVSGNI